MIFEPEFVEPDRENQTIQQMCGIDEST